MTLEILSHDSLAGFRHGFFTRRGGASSGIFKGLNCGFGSTDQRQAVALNRARVAQAMQVKEDALISVHQIHSADVVHVTRPFAGPKPQVDAMVSNTKGVALGILTADCEPVLFGDPDAGVVGAAHAGWQGALNGVLEATIGAMIKLGAVRENISAIVGPAISQRNYEVGPEFMDRFLDVDPDFGQFFAGGQGDRVHFDLPAFGVARLRGAGIKHAEWTRHCTYDDPDRFYSYRRTVHNREADYGRLISVICP